jgi:S1-C subfamily serine protease
VREGDLVIAVDGHRVATTSDVTTAVMSRGSGEPITFGIDRKAVGAIEITTRRT